MSEYRNRIAQTTTTTGTGTLTLGSAVAGHFALGASDDGVSFDWVIEDADGAAVEVGRDGVYTHSGTSFTRPSGNVERSTNGDALVSLSAGTHTVFLSPTANRINAVLLPQTSHTITTADLTATPNRHHRCTIAGLTANRNFKLPAGNAGDRIALSIVDGDASFALILIGDTGVTINGGSAATEWSRLFIKNEIVYFVNTGSSNWDVEIDGRISQLGKMNLTTSITTSTAGTWNATNFDTEKFDRGDIVDVGGSTSYITVRRTGKYFLNVSGLSNIALADQESWGVCCTKNGDVGTGTVVAYALLKAAASGTTYAVDAKGVELNAGDQLQHNFYHGSTANAGLRNDFYSVLFVQEIL